MTLPCTVVSLTPTFMWPLPYNLQRIVPGATSPWTLQVCPLHLGVGLGDTLSQLRVEKSLLFCLPP